MVYSISAVTLLEIWRLELVQVRWGPNATRARRKYKG